jgi:homoserine acetyltransferase
MSSQPKRQLTEEQIQRNKIQRQIKRIQRSTELNEQEKTKQRQNYQKRKYRNQQNNNCTSTIDNNEYLTTQQMNIMDYHHDFGAQHENLKNTKIGVPYSLNSIQSLRAGFLGANLLQKDNEDEGVKQ